MATGANVAGWPADLAARYRDRGYWRGETLGTALGRAARSDPGRVALTGGTTSLSFGALLASADAVGGALRERGLGAGDAVIVQLPNIWQGVVATLACLRTGLVPLWALSGHREHEIRGFATRADARAIVVEAGSEAAAAARRVVRDGGSLDLVVEAGGPAADDALSLDDLCRAARDDRHDETGPPALTSPWDERRGDDLAVLIPSGGTTGEAKLIPRTHDDLGYMTRTAAALCGVTPEDTYLAVLPLGHGFPNTGPGVLGTLAAGGSVVVAPSPNPAVCLPLVAAHGVTVTSVVPAVLDRWVEWFKAPGMPRPERLRLVQSGAARLRPALVAEAEQAFGTRIQQVYGMAEGLLCLTRPEDPDDVVRHTQGRPVSPDDRLRVVDDQGRDVPDGEVGVLWTQGPYTTRRYYRAPDLDAAAFRDGWYVTGDLVRRLPDGNVQVVGRTKNLVNRGGEKIGADEVADAVVRHPGVVSCVVVPVADAELGERVAAVVVPAPGDPVRLDDLRDHLLAGGLAPFKVPERLVLTDRIPVSPMGKVDRAAAAVLAADALTGPEVAEVDLTGDDLALPGPAGRPAEGSARAADLAEAGR